MSSALIDSATILHCVSQYVSYRTEENEETLERIISREMKSKKYAFFGRTLTREETIAKLEGRSSFESYNWSYWAAKHNDFAYDREVEQVRRLAKVAEFVDLSNDMAWLLNYKGVV